MSDDDITIAQDAEAAHSGYERVLGFIREQLLSGRLKIGDRLLAERELAVRLGVSRPVVREVLRALSAMGIVDIRHGQGSVVREPDTGGLADLFTLMLAQRADAVDDVLEARIAIERHAVRLAAQRATAADLSRLEDAWRDIRETMHDPARGSEADFEFHLRLVQAAHAPTLASLYSAIASLLRRNHRARRERISGVAGIDAYLVDHHRLILEALLERDGERAETLLAQHFAIGIDFQRRAMVAGLREVQQP